MNRETKEVYVNGMKVSVGYFAPNVATVEYHNYRGDRGTPDEHTVRMNGKWADVSCPALALLLSLDDLESSNHPPEGLEDVAYGLKKDGNLYDVCDELHAAIWPRA
jgi:hypothetical protein